MKSNDFKPRTFKAKDQRVFRLFYGVCMIFIMFMMGISMQAIADGEGASYVKYTLSIIALSTLFLLYIERLSTTLIFRVQRRKIKFEIIDLSSRYHRKIKGVLLIPEIIGLDYEENEILIETNLKVFRFNTIGLRELGCGYKDEVQSRYIYDILKERLGDIKNVDRGRIPFVDRHIYKG
jgi:hypothetical protein